jgi:hypothetical protein
MTGERAERFPDRARRSQMRDLPAAGRRPLGRLRTRPGRRGEQPLGRPVRPGAARGRGGRHRRGRRDLPAAGRRPLGRLRTRPGRRGEQPLGRSVRTWGGARTRWPPPARRSRSTGGWPLAPSWSARTGASSRALHSRPHSRASTPSAVVRNEPAQRELPRSVEVEKLEDSGSDPLAAAGCPTAAVDPLFRAATWVRPIAIDASRSGRIRAKWLQSDRALRARHGHDNGRACTAPARIMTSR